MTPNQITTVRLVAGIAAAAALAVGEAPWQDVGAGIFVVAMIMDRADGELARLGGKTTPWGHTYDLIADAFCDALILIGLGIGLRNGIYGVWAIPMGLVAGVSVATMFLLVMRLETIAGERAAEMGAFAGFDPDDAMLIIPITVWLGGATPLLLAAAVGAPAFMIFFLWFLRRRANKAAAGP